MKKKYISDLADLYTGEVINENEDNKVWKSGDCPEALGDSPHAEAGVKPDNSGPGGVEGVQAPVDNDDEQGITNKQITQNKEKPEKKSENLNERSINNCTMSKTTNIFDKLYATIMEADDLDDENFDLGAGLGADSGEDDLEELGVDEAGDEVTLSLPRDLAEKLCDALKAELGEGGEGEEDELDFGDDEGGDEDPLMEGGETKSSGQEDGGKPKAQTGVMPHGKPGDNKVGNVRPSGGKASGDASGEVDGGKPKAHSGTMPHGKPGDNKVKSPGTAPGEFFK